MTDRTPSRDSRKVHVPAPGAGAAGPPPRPGSPPRDRKPPASSQPQPASRRATTPAPAGGRARTAPPVKASSNRPPPAAKAAPPSRRSRRGKGLRRPRLRRLFMLTSLFLPLLILLGALGGWLYARSVYNKVEKIPLGDVLSTAGGGTNYLIVGSDSRNVDDLVDAGLNPEAFEDGGGQRSDTMLLLRFVDGKAKMMSIPRDLYVPIAETDGSAKINSAYQGGPRRLVLTVQQALGLPVHHYMEVDFVSFARLVDSLGGITIDFPNPAYDRNTGLDVQQAGPAHLDGPQSLAYVRSRHYVEVIDGRDRPDFTADLGRVQRQQHFLSAVFSKLGDTRNPIALAKAASSASGGLRIDDQLGMLDAVRLAWRLRSLDPEPVPLPVTMGSNRSGSVLFLDDPDAQTALDQFR